MPTINVTVPSTRNTEMPIFTLPAATEQDVVFNFPVGVDNLEITLLPVPADVKIAHNSVAGGGPADADKVPVPTSGFVLRFRRGIDQSAVTATMTKWFFSTTGGKVLGFVR